METYVYTWSCEEEERTDIRIYGISPSNESTCLRIENFTPYVYVEMPSEHCAQELKDAIGRCTVLTQVMWKENLYNFSGKTKPFLFCQCVSRKKINEIGWILKDPTFSNRFKLHEQTATSILQLVSLKGIPMAGWIKFDGIEVVDEEERLTACDLEYVVRWQDLSKGERVEPVFPKTMAFDFEVNSEIENAFPDDRPDDAIFQISCVIQREQTDEKRKILLTLDGSDLDSDQLSGITVMSFQTEEELLLGFIELIKFEKPNVMTGYNIFVFDISYLIKRCNRYFLTDELKLSGFNRACPAVEKKIEWESSAFKSQIYAYIDWEGILLMDLYPIVKRGYKLDNYKLHTVGNFFLGTGKDPVTVKDIFNAYRSKRMATVGKYCVQDSDLCVDLLNKLHCWIEFSEMAKVCNVSVFTLFTQGQQVQIFSQVYRYCLRKNIVVDSNGYECKSNERYIGAYVFDPVPGYYNKVVPLDFSSLYPSIIIAYNICYSTIVFNEDVPDESCNEFVWEDHVGCPHDPQIIKAEKLSEKIDAIELQIRHLMDKRDAIKAKDLAKGDTKTKAKKRVQNEINKLRTSQQPLREERQDLKKQKKDKTAQDGTVISGIICEKRRYRFLKPDVKKGVIPTIIQDLLDCRKAVKNRMKTDVANRIVLDKQQLAYKVSANSMYGAMGVRKGYLPFMPGAMCITYLGRETIKRTSQIITEKWKGKLIYGDTDSNYVVFPHLTTAKETWDYAIEVAEGISKEFPAPMKLEFEQAIYERFLIVTKKLYVYQSIDRDGVLDPKIGRRGGVLVKRDFSKFVKTIYERLVTMIFEKVDGSSIKLDLIEYINDLFRNVVPYSQFVTTKSIGDSSGKVDENGKLGQYTVKQLPTDPVEKERILNGMTEREYHIRSCPPQIRLAEKMRLRGVPIDVGSRLEYVALEVSGAASVGDKIEDFDYFLARTRYLKIDKLYYLSSLIKPIDKVMKIIFGENRFIATQFAYRKNYQKVLDELKRAFSPKIKCVT